MKIVRQNLVWAAGYNLVALPLAAYLSFDDFLVDSRQGDAVVVPLETLLTYLKDVGLPDDLVNAVETSAQGC